jgi:hypothetical protein
MFRGMAASRSLAGDKDVVAGRDITGGGEEEILGEGAGLRVPTML